MQKLFSTFIQDAYRSYCTKRFVFAVLGVAFFNFLSVYWDMLLGSANCVAYLYMISGIMGIETLYLLLSVLPGTILFRVDKNENYQRNVLLRSGKIAYLLSKVVITVFTAISVSLIGDFLFICALEMRYPFTTDEFSEQVLSLYGCSVLEYIFRKSFIKSISASAFSSMALYISSRTKNILIILFSPIILYYLWLRLCRILGLPQWLDIALLIRGETLGTATSLLVFVIVIVASSALFIMEANRSME